MALIKCPECGKEISDKAISCLRCGCPVSKMQTSNSVVISSAEKDAEAESEESGAKKSSYCIKCGKELSNSNSVYCEECHERIRLADHQTHANTQTDEKKAGKYISQVLRWILAGFIFILALALFSSYGITGIFTAVFLVSCGLLISPLSNELPFTMSRSIKTASIIVLFIAALVATPTVEKNNSSEATVKTDSSKDSTNFSEPDNPQIEKNVAEIKESETVVATNEESIEPEEKIKYYVGDSYQSDSLKITYTDCYEFTDFTTYNAPEEGTKVICVTFEFENIGESDKSVMYTAFNGYADGYEVKQNYIPEGTGLEFSLSLSSGRKGTGIIAFEVPDDALEIEIEYSPNMWKSEKIIFVYENK